MKLILMLLYNIYDVLFMISYEYLLSFCINILIIDAICLHMNK